MFVRVHPSATAHIVAEVCERADGTAAVQRRCRRSALVATATEAVSAAQHCGEGLAPARGIAAHEDTAGGSGAGGTVGTHPDESVQRVLDRCSRVRPFVVFWVSWAGRGRLESVCTY